jgi:hypothetical protein
MKMKEQADEAFSHMHLELNFSRNVHETETLPQI